MSYMTGAVCVMCASGVHDDKGRVACDSCDLPTDCCLCPDRSLPSVRALEPGPIFGASMAPPIGPVAGARPPRGPGARPPGARPTRSPEVLALSAGTPPPRLAELIVGAGCRPAPFARPATAMPRTALEGSRVILADSVAVYAEAIRRAGHTVRLRDLPNLLPPHRRCFIEMRGVEGRVSRWGAYLATSPAGGDAGSRAGEGGAGHWLVRAGLITVVGDDVPVGPVLLYRWHLDDMGRLLADPRGPAPSGLSVAMPRLLTTPPGGSREAFKAQCTRNYFTPVLLALAFLHCEETAVEPVDLATAGAPAGRLRLQPFEALLARAARAGTSAAQAAAELVPGRFEDGRRRLSTGISGPIRWRPENADDLLHRRSG